jgi:glutamyl-Q tRNA(Asp) synthetase
VASYADARVNGGEWLVRMEDLDRPRCVPGADAGILRTLEAFGFEWDGPVMYQSQRDPAYREAFEDLQRKGAVYPCSCSRRETGGGVYPGTCRTGLKESGRPIAWRILRGDPDDFVVWRADGLFSYQLAVVVDDAAQSVTDVVRGADLLDSVPRQIFLQKLFGYPTPRYLHVPVAVTDAGEKLSKQTKAPAIESADAPRLIAEALRFLGQQCDTLADAARLWNPASLPVRPAPRGLDDSR